MNEHKVRYNKIFHPAVMQVFGDYMTRCSLQDDGTRRSFDNWQRGIPISAYADSLESHTHQIQLFANGCVDMMEEELEDAACAAIFNAMGILHEFLVDEGLFERKPFNPPGPVHG